MILMNLLEKGVSNGLSPRSLPQHLAMLWDVVSEYVRRPQYLIGLL